MTASDGPSDREIDLATSDETVEELLSGGADIDELIAAGVLDTDEPASEADEEEGEIELEPLSLSEEEVMAWFNERRQRLEASGHRRVRIRI